MKQLIIIAVISLLVGTVIAQFIFIGDLKRTNKRIESDVELYKHLAESNEEMLNDYINMVSMAGLLNKEMTDEEMVAMVEAIWEHVPADWDRDTSIVFACDSLWVIYKDPEIRKNITHAVYYNVVDYYFNNEGQFCVVTYPDEESCFFDMSKMDYYISFVPGGDSLVPLHYFGAN